LQPKVWYHTAAPRVSGAPGPESVFMPPMLGLEDPLRNVQGGVNHSRTPAIQSSA
jgi:hypothetical protein